MLDKQINLFKVDTSAFLTDEEKLHRDKLVKIKKERQWLYEKKKVSNRESTLEKTIRKYKDCDPNDYLKDKYTRAFILKTRIIDELEKEWKKYILQSAKDGVEYNKKHKRKHIRNLDERYLSYEDVNDGSRKINLSNVVAMFESTLSRSFNIQTDELTYDIFIVEIYYYDIAQDIICNGFNYNGKHYVYFSSSAGQIRTKKAVFVEEQKYEACKLKLMCGLTVDKINECGGMNINKYLAYIALTNSATDLWEDIFGFDFDIDRTIVVDDFETLVKCKVDNIDYETYEITPGVEEEIPIPHTDGCGMIDPNICKKNFMIRLPFIKGLLGSFDFKRFVSENGRSSTVKDIWGKEYDVIKDDIQIIFTKSQLKMYKFYDSWDQYKEYFKKYKCEAGICNLEEDNIPNAKINYQMLQTLYDATDEEIMDMCSIPNKKIKEISDSLDNALDFFGVRLTDEVENHKDYFQKALRIYPELLSDPATRNDLKDLKKSLVKKYRSGKLDVSGKFTFVLPDLYAFCEWLFCGIQTPKGLLEDKEVFCRLYEGSSKLDCLRSPHLYIEHAIRNNVCNKKYRNEYLRDWFTTDAIYTSTYDPISRILQLDVDGDKLLVLGQPKLIEMAERVTHDVYPLYYEMKKANAEEINSENIYRGLELAFTGGRIGGISNNITKIWNSENITEEAKNVIKWLCMETNFTIDYAKTLFKPVRPKAVDELIKKYSKLKVPYFFQYAKDKEIEQCEDINNSMMNRIVKTINENKNMFYSIKNLADVDYLMLLKDKNDFYYNEQINKRFDSLNKKYGNNINIDEDDTNKNNIKIIAKQVRDELEKIEPDRDKVINSLVSFLYKKKSERKKKLLWYVYGEELYHNLCNNVDNSLICSKCGRRTNYDLIRGKCHECIEKELKSGKKEIQCIDCGKTLYVNINNRRTCRCPECQKKYILKYDRQRKAKKSVFSV